MTNRLSASTNTSQPHAAHELAEVLNAFRHLRVLNWEQKRPTFEKSFWSGRSRTSYLTVVDVTIASGIINTGGSKMQTNGKRPRPWDGNESAWCRVIGKACRGRNGFDRDTFNDVWLEIICGYENRKKPDPQKPLGWLKKTASRAVWRSEARRHKQQRREAPVGGDQIGIFDTVTADRRANDPRKRAADTQPKPLWSSISLLRSKDPADHAADNDEVVWLTRRLGLLNPRVRDAVMAKFQFEGAPTVHELASRLRLSEERIRQLANEGVRCLAPNNKEELGS